MDKTVRLEREEDVATISFDRKEAMNAYNDVMSVELLEAMKSVAADNECRFVVLKGVGDLFMAGGDIQFFHDHLAEMPKGVGEIIERLTETITLMQKMDKLVIADVRGACAGVGLSFMLACDFSFVANDCKFNTAYNAIGLSPDGGFTHLLRQHLGVKKAFELTLLHPVFDAYQALQLGLVTEICEREALDCHIDSAINQLRQRSVEAQSNTKRLLYQASEHSLGEQMGLEKDSFIELCQSPAFKAAVTAFMAKASA